MDDAQTLATLLFSETKDLEDAKGIANVTLNRIKRGGRFGTNIQEVVYAPQQFSGVGTKEWNKAANMQFANKNEENIYKQFLQISNMALNGKLEDNTAGADHYVNLKISNPSWAKKMKQTTKIGQHTYFNELGK